MKIINTILAILIITSLFSCQKGVDGTGTTTVSSAVKIKTYTEDLSFSGTHSVTTFNLSYDSNDRLISMVSAASPGDKFLFQYNSNTSYTMDLYNSNVLSIHEAFFLNASSYIDSTFQYNDTKDTSTEKYFYNSAKQLIKINEYDYTTSAGAVLWSSQNFVYDANGNVTSATDGSSVIKYDYYTNLTNPVNLFPFSLPTSKYLIKTETHTSGGTTDILNHTYTFDSNNRLSTDQITVTGSTEVLIKTYTYY